MNHFALFEHDKTSALWVRFKVHLQERLDDLRTRNDAPQSETDTASIRGEIRCIKRFIDLDADRPFVTGED